MMPIDQKMASTSLGLRVRDYDRMGGKCGAAAFSSHPHLKTYNGHRAACPPWWEVEVNIIKIWLLVRKRIYILKKEKQFH
jgi:hypothetical protein